MPTKKTTQKPFVLQAPFIPLSEEAIALGKVRAYYQRKTGHKNWSAKRLVYRLVMEKYADITKDLI